ncbi:MAG: NADH-quinone oxidoreductase subunit C [Verrucomicrobia bacterium]|nr:NADH-quinone oxidoreductase subunit C [Verrucomicrobiota bacterium]
MDAAALTSRFPALRDLAGKDMPTYEAPGGDLLAVVKFLRDEQGFDLLADLCGVEWKDRTPRFGVVIHLLTTASKEYVRLHVPAVDDRVPSVSSLHPGANWHEREAYDMYGIRFDGHPDLRRILMWDGYPYHPLRKDFPLAGIEVPLPAADVAEVTGQAVEPAPMMGGPFVSHGGRMSEGEPSALDQSWTEERPKS